VVFLFVLTGGLLAFAWRLALDPPQQMTEKFSRNDTPKVAPVQVPELLPEPKRVIDDAPPTPKPMPITEVAPPPKRVRSPQQRLAVPPGWFTSYREAREMARERDVPLCVVFFCPEMAPVIDDEFLDNQDVEFDLLQKRFVCVRLGAMRDIDPDLIPFDFDLTWWVVFLDGNDSIYSRFAGSTLTSLKHTMKLVIENHRQRSPISYRASTPSKKARLLIPNSGCVRCHEVAEAQFQQARRKGPLGPQSLYPYPPPEVLGFTMNPDAGNVIAQVAVGSRAHTEGLRAGQVLLTVDKTKILAEGDLRHAFHIAPRQGTLTFSFLTETGMRACEVAVGEGWKRSDQSWRRSLAKGPRK